MSSFRAHSVKARLRNLRIPRLHRHSQSNTLTCRHPVFSPPSPFLISLALPLRSRTEIIAKSQRRSSVRFADGGKSSLVFKRRLVQLQQQTIRLWLTLERPIILCVTLPWLDYQVQGCLWCGFPKLKKTPCKFSTKMIQMYLYCFCFLFVRVQSWWHYHIPCSVRVTLFFMLRNEVIVACYAALQSQNVITIYFCQ